MTNDIGGASAGAGSGRVMRWALAVGAVTLFVGIARLAEPRRSAASPAGEEPVGTLVAGGQGGRATIEPVQKQAGTPMGELIGREYLVRLTATDEGTRYTVCTLGGEVLESGLEAGDVYRLFPGLDLETLRFGPDGANGSDDVLPGPLMLVDPRTPFD